MLELDYKRSLSARPSPPPAFANVGLLQLIIMTARPGRAQSGPWGRLKPPAVDYLESYGLPSKGENRLHDFKTQERYYTKIVDRYMNFCSKAGRGDELSRQLSSLSIPSTDQPVIPLPTIDPNSLSPCSTGDVASNNDLSVLTMAMRKLREGIVASKRVDNFSIQAYMFCIRLTILLKHYESYHPAILYLLRNMHSIRPLSKIQMQEFAGYLVLDLACRKQDFAQAYAARHAFSLHDSKIDATLGALVHDNYHKFWKIKRSVDGHKAKLMEYAEKSMRLQALKCLGRTYFTVDVGFLESTTNTTWFDLKNQQDVGWELEGREVVIRRPKAR